MITLPNHPQARGRICCKTRQLGYSLMMAASIIALLTMLALSVLEAVRADVQLAGGDRAAQNSMYVAEGGAQWAKQALIDILFPDGLSGTPNIASLTALPALSNADPLCPENNCVTPPCPVVLNCSQWFLLTGASWVPYGSGQYRAAATCSPNCSVATPQQYLVRAMGQMPDGSRRLLELTLGPQ